MVIMYQCTPPPLTSGRSRTCRMVRPSTIHVSVIESTITSFHTAIHMFDVTKEKPQYCKYHPRHCETGNEGV
jgi:hypothetical protein